MNPYHYKTLLLAADVKSSEGHFDEAEEFIKKALDERPHDPEGYVRYASLLNGMYIRKGDEGIISDAVDQIRRALAIQPDNYNALNTLGYLYINEQNYKGALDSFERAVSLNPRPAAAGSGT
ncbi:MAG TPA: tetratricopeptide repeat protein [Spirochaetota bacterium]|nr:tetratricopeptide repeat protein [Spirochaetota bacterium]